MLKSLGAIAATFVCPLDVIKTRFQVHGLPKIQGRTFRGIFFLSAILRLNYASYLQEITNDRCARRVFPFWDV